MVLLKPFSVRVALRARQVTDAPPRARRRAFFCFPTPRVVLLNACVAPRAALFFDLWRTFKKKAKKVKSANEMKLHFLQKVPQKSGFFEIFFSKIRAFKKKYSWKNYSPDRVRSFVCSFVRSKEY